MIGRCTDCQTLMGNGARHASAYSRYSEAFFISVFLEFDATDAE